MRKRSSMPGWRSLASRYCCIMGVSDMIVRASRCGTRSCRPGRRAAELSAVAVAQLGHGYGVAGGAERNIAHVIAHEHQAPAARAFEVLDAGGVGNLGRIEAAALVGDGDV